jgi:FADH2 O2-dependent halogenase
MTLNNYDCVVIGSGIIGASAALVLAQTGLKVLVIESGTHPRFAIGEALVPTTTLGFYYLAQKYNIPELRQVTHYPELKERGNASWPKLGFWFGHHQPGIQLQPGQEMMLVSPGFPIGPDVHLLRSDVDSFLVSCLPRYGVNYREQTQLQEYIADSEQVKLVLKSAENLEEVNTRFVLDCSGYNSFLAAKFKLRESPCRFNTNSRVLFSHFQEVAFLEDVLQKPEFVCKRDATTIHHCFDGGWIWIIRFDNQITSVGLVLDRDRYPDNSLPPEEEFWSFINSFPTVAAQMKSAKPIRPFTKTGRIQYSSHSIAGDRYLIAPSAAAFVDPLFSTGIDLGVAFVGRAVPVIETMIKTNNFHPSPLEPLQKHFQKEINLVDKIVHGMFCSFRSFDIFKQYWRCWVYMSLVQYFTYLAYEPTSQTYPLAHYGADLPSWQGQLNKMYDCLIASAQSDAKQVAAELKSIMDLIPEPFHGEGVNWEIGSTKVCSPRQRNMEWFVNLLAQEPLLAKYTSFDSLAKSQMSLPDLAQKIAQRYQNSQKDKTGYHQGVDFIQSQEYAPLFNFG